MSSSFLARVAHALLASERPLVETTVVVPNRRAGIFLLEALRTAATTPCIAPEVRTWSEFLASQSTLVVPDALTQVLTLYKVWQETFVDEPLEAFYPWGEVLLADFDAVDRQLVDANQLFQNLADLDTLDAAYPLEVADMPRLQAFWQSLTGAEQLGTTHQFLHVWQALGAIYHGFHTKLTALGYTTEALVARRLAEHLQAGGNLAEDADETAWVFVGFSALAAAEEHILHACMARYNARLFVDGDTWYVDAHHHQAGYHLRKRIERAPKPTELRAQLSTDFATLPRTLTTHRCPTATAQVLALAELLHQLPTELTAEQGLRTAIVLPDENLLPHVLQRLPEGLHVNITMGYPLVQTQVYRWFHGLLDLWLSGEWTEGGALRAFYVRPLEDWLGMGLSHRLLGETTHLLLEQLRSSGWQYLPLSELQVWTTLPGWLTPPAYAGVADLLAETEHLHNVLRTVASAGELPVLESEAALLCWQHTQRLADGLVQAGIQLPRNAYWRLVRQSLRGVRIPFVGEPLGGVQIMGFLETRLLDFDRLFLLSANEGTLPPAPPAHSFIPYGLRKAFGLPTREDTQAVNAYHFYRLLQRCHAADLFYATDSDEGPSRYLLQLELEVAPTTQTRFQEIQRATGLSHFPAREITVQKAEAALQMLAAYTRPTEDPKPRTFSPTALNTYIRCPLKFYYRYVAGLKEPEETGEELDTGLFGQLLHTALHLAYEPLVGKQLTNDSLDTIEAEVDAILERAVRETLPPGVSVTSGANRLKLGAIRRLLLAQVAADRQAVIAGEAPLLLGTELKLETTIELPDGTHVALAGTLDRVQRIRDTVQVLDYKTGSVQITNPKVNYLDALFQNDSFKKDRYAELQTLLYAWLYLRKQSTPPARIETGVIAFRKLEEGYLTSNYDLGDEANRRAFERRLAETLVEMRNPAIPFKQRVDESCATCPYYRLCYHA